MSYGWNLNACQQALKHMVVINLSYPAVHLLEIQHSFVSQVEPNFLPRYCNVSDIQFYNNCYLFPQTEERRKKEERREEDGKEKVGERGRGSREEKEEMNEGGE